MFLLVGDAWMERELKGQLLPCVICGKNVIRYPYQLKRHERTGTPITCSRECSRQRIDNELKHTTNIGDTFGKLLVLTPNLGGKTWVKCICGVCYIIETKQLCRGTSMCKECSLHREVSDESKKRMSDAHKGISTGPMKDATKILMSEQRKGEGNPCWKGGRVVQTRGYISVLAPDHPYKDSRGYVTEHRLIMEQHIGRYLTESEVVHHINKDTSDNDISNLMLFPSNSEHLSYHAAQRRREKEEDEKLP